MKTDFAMSTKQKEALGKFTLLAALIGLSMGVYLHPKE